MFVFHSRLCVEISLCKGVHLCHYTVCGDVESNIWVICCLQENQKRHWMHFLTWLILLCETPKHNLYNHYSLCVFCFLWFNNCCKSPVSHLNNKFEMTKSLLLASGPAYLLNNNHHHHHHQPTMLHKCWHWNLLFAHAHFASRDYL